jgi:adenylate cyclase
VMPAAREMFSKAIEVDPSYCQAYGYTALSYHIELFAELTDSRAEAQLGLRQAVDRAIALNGNDWLARSVAALEALWRGDHDRAILEAFKAVELNPNSETGLPTIGAALDFAGRPDEAIPHFERVLRLSPLHPRRGVYVAMLARAQLHAGRFESAVASALGALGDVPNLIEAHLILASALAHLARQDEAAEVYRRARSIRPQGIELPSSWKRYRGPDGGHLLIDGLRKAGWEG